MTASEWNLDYAWFTKEESVGFAPQVHEAGTTYDVAHDLVLRLVRFHLIDNVRGQT